MIRVLTFVRGMRVVTRWGAVARVDGMAPDCCIALTFLDGIRRDPQPKDSLAAYDGPPVLFADEVDALRRRDKLRERGAKA